MSPDLTASAPAATTARHRRPRPVLAALGLVTIVTLGLATGATTAVAAATTWRQQTTPGAAGRGFSAISCSTPTSCVAVGSTFVGATEAPVAETESGGVWHVDGVPQASGSTVAGLDSVSCASVGRCVAVGTSTASNRTRPFTVVLQAGTWKKVAVPTIPAAAGANLAAVSCAEVSDCRAVGSWFPSSGFARTLVEVYNGSVWKLDATPAVSGSASFSGVSCLPETVPALCTAVGEITLDSRTEPLVEHADGDTWSTVTVPTAASSTETSLASVSCPGSTSCVAVGSALEGSTFRSISEIDDQGHWTIVRNPAIAGASDSLAGVSCPLSIGSCRAVGTYGPSSETLTLAETWNGRTWSIQSSADPSNLSELEGVSCVIVGQQGVGCGAAGEYQDDPMAPSHLLAETDRAGQADGSLPTTLTKLTARPGPPPRLWVRPSFLPLEI